MTKLADCAAAQGTPPSRIASRLLAKELTIEDMGRVAGKHFTKVWGLGEMGDWFEP